YACRDQEADTERDRRSRAPGPEAVVTRNRSLEQIILIEDVVVVIVSLLLSGLVHARLASSVPGLKPPIPFGEYAHLLLVFLPTWVFAAERLGINHLRALTGSRFEVVR